MSAVLTRLVAIGLLAVPLAACDTGTEVSNVAEEFTITKVKPPKRLYVDVIDKDGKSYQIYVSKRCSTWQQIVIGSKVTLNRVTYRYDGGRIETDVRLKSSSDICPS